VQELISLLDQQTVFAFLLLLARILSFMAFMPIVGHKSVNPTIRIAISFYFAVFIFPLISYDESLISQETFLLALISEITLGLVASFLVQIIFAVGFVVAYLLVFLQIQVY